MVTHCCPCEVAFCRLSVHEICMCWSAADMLSCELSSWLFSSFAMPTETIAKQQSITLKLPVVGAVKASSNLGASKHIQWMRARYTVH